MRLIYETLQQDIVRNVKNVLQEKNTAVSGFLIEKYIF